MIDESTVNLNSPSMEQLESLVARCLKRDDLTQKK